MTDENRARPGGVLAVGIISIIFGVLGLLLGALMVLAFSKTAQEQDIPRVTMLYSTIPYGIAGIAWIIAGIGLLSLRNWARVTIIVLSVFATGLSILTFVGIAIAFVFIGITKGSPGPFEALIASIIGIILLAIFAGIPIWFIVYLNKGEIKKHFKIRPDAIKRPLGVNILIALYFLSVLSIVSIFHAEGGPVCGTILRGAWFRLYWILIIAACLYIAIGFIKLRRRAWLAAMYYNAFIIISVLMTVLMLDPEEILAVSGVTYRNTGLYTATYPYFMYFAALLSAIIMLYLYKKRNLFTCGRDRRP